MPFAPEDNYRATKHLNFALIKLLPYLLANQQNEFYTYDAKLNPAEYYAGMPAPRLFEQDDIDRRMNAIEAEFLVQAVIEVLDELDQLDIKIKKEMSSSNYALTEADKLKWNQEARSLGMEARRMECIDRLRYFLKLPPTPPIDGVASLGRS